MKHIFRTTNFQCIIDTKGHDKPNMYVHNCLRENLVAWLHENLHRTIKQYLVCPRITTMINKVLRNYDKYQRNKITSLNNYDKVSPTGDKRIRSWHTVHEDLNRQGNTHKIGDCFHSD